MKRILCESWLNGKYTLTDGTEAEINTRLPFIAIGDFYAQGEEADSVIHEINVIFNQSNLTAPESIERWAANML